MIYPTERGCAFCWPLTPRGRIVLGPRIGICEGCAGISRMRCGARQ